MAEVQSARVSSQASLAKFQVNQATLAQGADSLYRPPSSSHGEHAVLGTELAKLRVKQAAPEHGCQNCESVQRQHLTLWTETEKAFTIIRAKTLYELDCARVPMRRAFPTDP